MKKQIISMTAAIAMAAGLFSCAGKKSDTESSKKAIQSRVADFSEVYKDFFDYTFDGDYTINIAEEGVINEGTDREQAYRYYDISYVRKDGTKRNAQVTSAEFNERESEQYESEQRMNNEEISAFCGLEIKEVFIKEFIENIMCKYLDIEYEEGNGLYETDDCHCSIILSNPIGMFSKESDIYENGCRLVESHIAPETGYKLSEADLKTAANDKEFVLVVSLLIKSDDDVQPYIDKMNGIIGDYFAYAGNPMNCKFIIKTEVSDSNKRETAFNKCFFMGEELSEEESKDFNIIKEVTRACVEE